MAAARLGRPLCVLSGTVCSKPGAPRVPRISLSPSTLQLVPPQSPVVRWSHRHTTHVLPANIAAAVASVAAAAVCTHLDAALRSDGSSALVNLPAVCTELTVHLERLRKVWTAV